MAAWLAATCLIAAGHATAQEAAHQAHHAASASAETAAAAQPRASAPSPANAGMGGMQSMMGESAGGSSAPIYPSFMRGTEFTAAEREALRTSAERRVHDNEQTLDIAHGRLKGAMESGDHDAAFAALRDAREAIGRLESGVSAHKLSMSEGASPRQPSLDWFRTELGVLAPDEPHGVFGLTWFHYLLMAAIASASAVGVGTHWHRRRRALLLAEQLARRDAGSAAALPAAAPITPKFNTWTGALVVTGIFDEAPGVKTFRLADPAGGPLPFRYLPGQFLTVTAPIGPSPVKRSYTIASSPAQTLYCEITVRHEPAGRVSGYLHGDVAVGSRLDVTAASGKFTFTGDGADSIVLIAGGVGITPMMCVIRYLADRSWPGDIYLVYGCKADDGFIFRSEIEYLASRHRNLHVTLVAEHAEPGRWPHPVGRINPELLAAAVPAIASRHVHLCGPKPMMEAVKPMLAGLGVPDTQVETEVFVGKEMPAARPPDDTRAPANATFARSGKSMSLPPSKTILEAAEEAGVPIEYSCRTGVCGACKVRLLSGVATMEVDEALTEEDKARNVVLACQARISADVVVDA